MTNNGPDSDAERDGNWFLEAVGANPPAPTGSEAIDELTRENDVLPPPEPEGAVPPQTEEIGGDTEPSDHSGESSPPPEPPPSATTQMVQTTQVTLSAFDGSPGTTNAAYAPTPSQKMPIAAALPVRPLSPEQLTQAPDADAPTEVASVDPDLSRPLRSRRSFRWPVIAVLVLLIIAVGVAAIFLPRAIDAEALAVRQTYYDATSDVRSYVPEAQVALDAVTDESSDVAELSSAIPRIAELDSRAFAMQEAAAESLPSTLPLVPAAAIDALVPLQDTTAALGDDGSDLAHRLGNAYIYRVSIPGLMQTGNLPTAATTETINEISGTLASSLADDAAAIAQLPDDPIFVDVQSLAQDSHKRYAVWQLEYLDALANEDRASAEALVEEIIATKAALALANTEALTRFRAEFDSSIVVYASDLEVHMHNLSQG